MSADAVTKVSHFGNLAQSTKNLPPNVSTHFDSVHSTVHDMHKTGKCNLQSYLGGHLETHSSGNYFVVAHLVAVLSVFLW